MRISPRLFIRAEPLNPLIGRIKKLLVRGMSHMIRLSKVLDRQSQKSSTNKWAIRRRKQQLIDYFKKAKSEKGISGNDIRGVSQDNPRGKIYHSEANRLFGELFPYTGNK